MNSIQRAIQLIAVCMFVLTASFTFGQMGMGQGMGQGMGKGMPMYDPSTAMTVKGTVQEVQEGGMQSGQMGHMHHMGTHLVLKTDDTKYVVLVGPSSFLKTKNFEFAKGDEIEVIGSKVKYNGAECLIAREIKKGDKVLTLRDEKGVPEWSMGRQR